MDNELIEQSFEENKSNIRELSESTEPLKSFEKVRTTGGPFNVLSHKVKGEELNNLIAQIQDHVSFLHEQDEDIIKSLNQIESELESYHKELLYASLTASSAAEKANERAVAAGEKADKVIDGMTRGLQVLQAHIDNKSVEISIKSLKKRLVFSYIVGGGALILGIVEMILRLL